MADRDIGLEHRELGAAARAGEDAREDREDDGVGRGGIRRGQDDRERLGERRGEADPLREATKSAKPPKAVTGLSVNGIPIALEPSNGVT